MIKKTKTLEDRIMTAEEQYQETGTLVAAIAVALHAGILLIAMACSHQEQKERRSRLLRRGPCLSPSREDTIDDQPGR